MIVKNISCVLRYFALSAIVFFLGAIIINALSFSATMQSHYNEYSHLIRILRKGVCGGWFSSIIKGK